MCGFTGSFIPFAATKAAREAAGDPRPSLEERYGDHAGYVAAVRAAAARLVAARLLLPADADLIIANQRRTRAACCAGRSRQSRQANRPGRPARPRLRARGPRAIRGIESIERIDDPFLSEVPVVPVAVLLHTGPVAAVVAFGELLR